MHDYCSTNLPSPTIPLKLADGGPHSATTVSAQTKQVYMYLVTDAKFPAIQVYSVYP